MTSRSDRVDRHSVPPFLLRVFYKQDVYPSIANLDLASSTASPSLTLHVWPNTTLLELSHIITHNLRSTSSALPDHLIGTRLCYRHVFQTTPAPASNRRHHRQASNTLPATYQTQDLGSIVLGGSQCADDDEEEEEDQPSTETIAKVLTADDDIKLSSVRFITGDILMLAILPPSPLTGAILPPIKDSSIQGGRIGPGGTGTGVDFGPTGALNGRLTGPTVSAAALGSRGWDMGREYASRGGGGGGAGYGPRNGYGNGFARERDREGAGRERGAGAFCGRGLPDGEWRRGEQPPAVVKVRGAGVGYRGGGGRW